MSIDDSPTVDRLFLKLLDEFEQALFAGQETSSIEQKLIQQYGRKQIDLLNTIKALHAESGSQQLSAHDATVAVTAGQSNEQTADHKKLPQRFGRFKILDRLGAGGNGIVLLAFDPQLNREVALKMPRADAAISDDLERRFLREGRAAASLEHPNIIPVYEAGKVDEGRYILSAYCPGPNLAMWMLDRRKQNQANDPRSVAQWMAQVADAVDYAHRQGVIHRDLKPSNIMLEPDEGSASRDDFAYSPRITDFGIAKLTSADSSVTQTGAILGTPQYMSPEQASGRTQQVNESSDIYAIGVILYELLVGKPPILGESILETLQKVMSDEPQSLRKQQPGIPRDLEVICLKCLEKSPEHRYASASDLASDLQRYLHGESIVARGQGTVRKTVNWVNRRRFSGVSVLTGAVVIAMLVFVAAKVANRNLNEFNDPSPLPSWKDPEALLRGGYYRDVKHAAGIWTDNFHHFRNQPNIVEAMEELLKPYIPQDGKTDLRGFEWHYLWKLCHPGAFAPPLKLLFSIKAHKGRVYYISFSPDNRTFATASSDNSVRIWDTESGNLLITIDGHADEVNSVVFSADGKRIITASDDKTVKVWEAATGKELGTFEGHDTLVVGASISPLTGNIASTDDSGVLKFWNPSDGKELHSIQAHKSRIESVEYSSDGKYLVTASGDHTTKVWDTSNYSLHFSREYGTAVRSAIFTHDSALVAYSGDSGDIKCEMVKSQQPWVSLQGRQNSTTQAIRIAPDDQTVASVGSAGPIYLWDVPTRSISHTIKPEGSDFWSLAFSPDGRRLAAGDSAGVVRVWDFTAGFHRTTISSSVVGLRGMALSPDSCLLAIGQGSVTNSSPADGSGLQIWDVAEEHPKLIFAGIDDAVLCISFAPDGKSMALGGLDAQSGESLIRVLDTETFQVQSQISLDHGIPVQIETLPDNQRLLVASHITDKLDNVVSLWDLQTNTKIGQQQLDAGHPGGENLKFTVSPDGSWVATNVSANLISLKEFDRHSWGTQIEKIRGGIGLDFSPDSQSLAIGLDHGKIHLCESSTGREIMTLMGGTGFYRDLKFSPDGNSLVAGGFEDATIRLWNVNHWEPLLNLPMPKGYSKFENLLFSDDGQTIVASGQWVESSNLPKRQLQGAENGLPAGVFLWRSGIEKFPLTD